MKEALMARYSFRISVLLWASVLSLSAADSRPNVLMIAVDDLNDYVSILQNHPGIKTPNFERLAKMSVNFTRAYCAAPVCQPSRAAITSGMAPHQTGIYELVDPLSKSAPALRAVSLEEQFKRHGYQTYLTGKYYHGSTASWWPAARVTAAWTQTKPPFSDHGPIIKGDDVMSNGVYSIGPAPGGMESMPDVKILKNTHAWLAQKHDQPFFMVHGISKPHLSFVVPQRFFDLYPLENIALPMIPVDDFADIPAFVKQTLLSDKDTQQFLGARSADNGLKKVMQAYLASISFCDWVLGDLLDTLEASAYANNTIVVLWSDHGYHIGEKEKFHKRALWTQSSRVPFLIHLPGMKTAGQACAAPVSLLDIFPTLCELCHLDQPVPQTLAGRTITPLVHNPQQSWPHVAVTSHGLNNTAITDEQYHYIHYADGSEEIYDHHSDPREYQNLAQQAEKKSIIERLAQHIPAVWVPASSKSKGEVK